MGANWRKIGRILAPRKNVGWISTWTGASFARRIGKGDEYHVYVTGRDARNRSQVGRIVIDVNRPTEVLDISSKPVFGLGEKGAFDENGVSYPWLVDFRGRVYMLYVGWMPTVLAPFMNAIGLAVMKGDGTFARVSRAPILPRDDNDFLSLGSSCALVEGNRWRLWYTSFRKWGTGPRDHKHYYVIKYAQSRDGLSWRRDNVTCIDFAHPGEYAIGRPSVLKRGARYHMWYSYRGASYRIGYATSPDGIRWTRHDRLAGISTSATGWDSESICYAHVFAHDDTLFMLFNGNQYGKDGLGIAVLEGGL